MTTVQGVARTLAYRRQRWGQALAMRALALARRGIRPIVAVPLAVRAAYYRAIGREDPARLAALRAHLLRFYDDFESLVDLICASARCGVVGGMAAEYRQLTDAMKRNYPAIRTYVLAFLDVDVADTEYGLSLCGLPLDALQCLYYPPDLEALHEADDGKLIARIERCRNALYRLADYLRELTR